MPTVLNSAAPLATARPLKVRLKADSALSQFKTQQSDAFNLCLSSIKSMETYLALPVVLSAAQQQSFKDKGMSIEVKGDKTILTFRQSLDLEQMLSGVELDFGQLPAGAVSAVTSFLDAGDQELGYISYGINLKADADNQISLDLKLASEPVNDGCPKLEASVVGADIQETGGNVVSVAVPQSQDGFNLAGFGNLRIIGEGDGYVILKWDSTPDAFGHQIFYNGKPVATIGKDSIFKVFGLPGGPARFGVRAMTYQGLSVESVLMAGVRPAMPKRGMKEKEGPGGGGPGGPPAGCGSPPPSGDLNGSPPPSGELSGSPLPSGAPPSGSPPPDCGPPSGDPG
ncbi:MAG: hypothetical protein ACAI44_19160, partial [Candidatus Sericytochromatia bacterium]